MRNYSLTSGERALIYERLNDERLAEFRRTHQESTQFAREIAVSLGPTAPIATDLARDFLKLTSRILREA